MAACSGRVASIAMAGSFRRAACAATRRRWKPCIASWKRKPDWRREHVEVVAATRGWLRYRLPHRYVRHHQRPTCIGQKQVWFLLRLVGGEESLQLDACEKPEFDIWRWVDFWYPAEHVVNFKRAGLRTGAAALRAPGGRPCAAWKSAPAAAAHDDADPGKSPAMVRGCLNGRRGRPAGIVDNHSHLRSYTRHVYLPVQRRHRS